MPGLFNQGVLSLIYDGLIHCIYSSYSDVMDARTVQSGYRVILFMMVLFTVYIVPILM